MVLSPHAISLSRINYAFQQWINNVPSPHTIPLSRINYAFQQWINNVHIFARDQITALFLRRPRIKQEFRPLLRKDNTMIINLLTFRPDDKEGSKTLQPILSLKESKNHVLFRYTVCIYKYKTLKKNRANDQYSQIIS